MGRAAPETGTMVWQSALVFCTADTSSSDLTIYDFTGHWLFFVSMLTEHGTSPDPGRWGRGQIGMGLVWLQSIKRVCQFSLGRPRNSKTDNSQTQKGPQDEQISECESKTAHWFPHRFVLLQTLYLCRHHHDDSHQVHPQFSKEWHHKIGM